MSDRLQELAAFVRTAEGGSFSRAARELGLSQPRVSRLVSELEARLGARLLLRTTRRVMPTDAGAVFLERARDVLRRMEEAEAEARGADSLEGLLRLAAPATFGARELVPRLAPFLRRHPKLRVDLLFSDDRQDLVAEGADLALRLGDLPDSTFGVRRLATAPRRLLAAPSYLSEAGAPRTPADLAAMAWVAGPGATGREPLRLQRGGAWTSVELEPRIRCTSAEGVLACLRAGLGVGVASGWMAKADLAAGALTAVLGDYAPPRVTLSAVFPGGPHPSAKVRAVADHLAASFAADP